MDEIKMNFGSNFMRRLIAKFVMRYIKKHFGCNTELDLDEFKFKYEDGDIVVKTKLEFRMNRKDIKKILDQLDDEL